MRMEPQPIKICRVFTGKSMDLNAYISKEESSGAPEWLSQLSIQLFKKIFFKFIYLSREREREREH